MRKCPRCGLVSPGGSVRCECGFLFDLALVMQQAIKVLQDSRHELADIIRDEILGRPILEDAVDTASEEPKTAEAAELVDRILTEFRTDARPPGRVVVHRCEECERVSTDFAGKHWTDLSPQVLRFHYDAIPLLSPEAFAYYLPAYLLFAARDPSSGVAEMLLYALGPTAGPGTAECVAACRYSAAQLQLLLQVAELIAGDHSEHFAEFSKRARAYWQR